MPIIPTQGSLETVSSRTTPVSLRPELQDKKPVLDNQALIQERVAQQTFLNNTAVNTDHFKNELSLIAGYPEGSIVKVTYYSLNSPLKDIRTDLIDILTPAKDAVHVDLTEIRQFELRLSGDFNFNYEEEKNISGITGEALVFAGFVPKVGDIFLYQLRNGKVGVFYVGGVRRLALGQDTYHQIAFVLHRYMDADLRDRLHRSVSAVFYFDKTKFLAGNHALLSSQGFLEQKDLRHLRLEIIQNYADRFYDTDFSSFMRPDGLYDPYVVEYWNKKVNYLDSPVRPVQLLIAVQNYKKTIWSVLTNNPIKDLKNVARTWEQTQFQSTFWGVNITSLLRENYIAVGDEKATDQYPTLNDAGQAVIYDPMPFIHSTRWDASIKDKAKALQHAWIRTFAFYNDLYPGDIPNGCPPTFAFKRSKYANVSLGKKLHKPFPIDEKLCSKCKFKDFCPTRTHLLSLKPPKHPGELPPHRAPKHPKIFRPPFPIHSKAELLIIWKQMNKIDVNTPTTPEQWDKFSAYATWYYNTYQGTYSKYELETSWRKSHGIKDNETLTDEQLAEVQKHIDWYRSRYPKVLADTELEVLWRTYAGIGLSKDLTQEEFHSLQAYIHKYRRIHGYVPNDDITDRSDEVPVDPSFLIGESIPLLYYQDIKNAPRPPVDTNPPPPYDGSHPMPPISKSGPPYPILSDAELTDIWRKIHGLEKNSYLTDDQILKAKGYILWYRETYPGTLSVHELLHMWRDEAQCYDPALGTEELAAFEKYVASYRANFLPVLTDREIEILWRTKLGIELTATLTDKQLVLLHAEIRQYRNRHGNVPIDRKVDNDTELGSPFTEDELKLLSSSTAQVPPEDSTTAGFEGDIVAGGDAPETPDVLLPTVYYPPIKGYHLCPNFCHFLCNPPQKVESSTDTKEDDGNSYALSKEFYFGSNAMDPFERILYNTITNKEIRPDLILEAVSRYLEWDDEDAFYRHLFCLYLIDRALYWLRYHS